MSRCEIEPDQRSGIRRVGNWWRQISEPHACGAGHHAAKFGGRDSQPALRIEIPGCRMVLLQGTPSRSALGDAITRAIFR